MLYYPEMGKKTVVIEHPEGFIAKEGLLESTSFPEDPSTKGFVKRITLDGIQLAQREVFFKKALRLEVEHDFPFLKMQFELIGHSSFESKIRGVPDVLIPGGTHQLIFIPEVKGKLFYPTDRRTLEINLSTTFLQRVFNEDLRELNEFGKGILHSDPRLLFPESRPILPRMKQCISGILSCEFTGKLKQVYLEAKVTELLCMQLKQCLGEGDSASRIKKDDVEKLYYVKELIEQNIAKPFTISELSQLAGMNDFKLKMGFKKLFGSTVFEYLTELRMKKASIYILENDYTISEASFLVGYKHPQHFASAFKKKFGYLPRELKK